MSRDSLYIEYVLDAISKIESYTKETDFNRFSEDGKTQSAVILQLVIIGEMAKKISEETKIKIELPWKDIVGFRDIAVHDYFALAIDIVWQTIIEDIPVMKRALSE
jgi:uncharacterized protein with HEPN domain